jgi:hypothetical protein
MDEPREPGAVRAEDDVPDLIRTMRARKERHKRRP